MHRQGSGLDPAGRDEVVNVGGLQPGSLAGHDDIDPVELVAGVGIRWMRGRIDELGNCGI